MGGLSAPGRSSLERLKALNDLPNLECQLAEAAILCTHSARAEMILRWMLDKLKNSAQARIDYKAWDVFHTAIRQLPIQRIAALLGPAAFMEVLRLACTEPEQSEMCLSAISRTVNSLDELGQTPAGGPIEALLSFSSERAASICGNWFRLVHKVRDHGVNSTSVIIQDSLVDPAIRIWSLRKRHESVDDHFNNQCLVPTCQLLALLESGNNHESQRRKRYRDGTNSLNNVKQTLEALLLRHTILPARTLFFKNMHFRGHQRHANANEAAEELLGKTLRRFRAWITESHDASCLKSIPLILSITLRSSPRSTPKDRIQERPWTEAVFTALHDCFRSHDKLQGNGTLIDLLEIIRHCGSLSSQYITTLAQSTTGVGADEEPSLDWNLLAKFVELNADVFANRDMTTQIFAAIVSTQKRQSLGAPILPDLRILLDTWKSRIVNPILHSFAKNRNLDVYIDLWSKQLDATAYGMHPEFSSFWQDLGSSLKQELESPSTFTHSMALFDELVSKITALPDTFPHPEDRCSFPSLYASFELLNAVLGAMHVDDLPESFHRKLEQVLNSILQLFEREDRDPPGFLCRTMWISVTKAFQLWFPLWSANTTESDVVAGRLATLLASRACTTALSHCYNSSKYPKTVSTQDEMLEAALGLIAALCSPMYNLDLSAEQQRSCFEVVAQIGKCGPAGLRALLCYPHLLAVCSHDVRGELLSKAAEHAVHNDELMLMATCYAALRGDGNDILENVVRFDFSSVQKKYKGLGVKLDDSESFALQFLSTIPVEFLGSAQRQLLFETLTSKLNSPSTPNGATETCSELALLMSLIGIPLRNSELYTDFSKLWNFTLRPVNEESRSEGNVHLRQLRLFEEIIRRLVRIWMASSNGKTEQRMLKSLSETVKHEIESLPQATPSGWGDRGVHLSIVKTAMEMPQSSKHEQISFVHQEPEVVRSYATQLFEEAKAGISIFRKHGLGDLPPIGLEKLCMTLEALLAIPETLLLSAISGLQFCKHFNDLINTMLRDHGPSVAQGEETNLEPALDVWKIAVVRCFQLVCKYSNYIEEDFATLGFKVLEHKLNAPEQQAALTDFSQILRKNDSLGKIRMVNSLTHDLSNSSAWSLMLLQTSIDVLSKHDLETGSETLNKNPLHYMLDVITKGDCLQIRSVALRSTITILQDKPFLISQNGVESTIGAMHHLVMQQDTLAAVYSGICRVVTTILIHHRSRVKGRFHLLNGLLQQLLFGLFRSLNAHDSVPRPGVRQARSYARLLIQLCNRPRVRSRGNKSELVDEARKAQAHAGRFVQYLLHHYCALTLSKSLAEGMREAIAPGIWAAIEAIEANSADGIKVLSSAMSNSERAVLRSVYDDWKNFGKWEGL